MSVAQSSVRRMWGGAPVVEARKPLRVFLLAQDIATAEKGNPTNCAFARAVRRSCGSSRAVFLRGTAYVELMQKNGQSLIERFCLPREMRQMIEAFDKTGIVPQGGFVLLPFSRSQTLDVKRKLAHAAIINGTSKPGTGTPRTGTSLPSDIIKMHGVRQKNGVRYGTGMVHFPQDKGSISWETALAQE